MDANERKRIGERSQEIKDRIETLSDERHFPSHLFHTVQELVELAEELSELACPTPPVSTEPPPPPWPIGQDNAKRFGWTSYFEGKLRADSFFPKARPELHTDYRVGWDAADAYSHSQGNKA